jgi:hypothetical protein
MNEELRTPVAELIVEQIEKIIPPVLSNECHEEDIIKMLCDILVKADDIPCDQKAMICVKFRKFASDLKSADEQKTRQYLLKVIDKLCSKKI